MASQIQNAAITTFKKDVVHQMSAASRAKLLEAHTSAGGQIGKNVEGELLKVPFVGKAEMVDRGLLTSVVTGQDLTWGQRQATFDNKTLLMYVDIFAKDEINFDEKEAVIKEIIKAKNLTEQQKVISSIIGATYGAADTAEAGKGYLFGTAVVGSVDFLVDLSEQFDERNIPEEGRVLVIDSKFAAQLKKDNKYNNSDYAATKVLVDGKLVNFMGFKIVQLGREESAATPGTYYGLPLDTVDGESTCFAYHVDGVYPGFGAVGNNGVDVQWVIERRSWGIAVDSRVGCLIKNPELLFKFIVDHNPA